jgi:hypothetical protein
MNKWKGCEGRDPGLISDTISAMKASQKSRNTSVR